MTSQPSRMIHWQIQVVAIFRCLILRIWWLANFEAMASRTAFQAYTGSAGGGCLI
jgi:hypothetical protein